MGCECICLSDAVRSRHFVSYSGHLAEARNSVSDCGHLAEARNLVGDSGHLAEARHLAKARYGTPLSEQGGASARVAEPEGPKC